MTLMIYIRDVIAKSTGKEKDFITCNMAITCEELFSVKTQVQLL